MRLARIGQLQRSPKRQTRLNLFSALAHLARLGRAGFVFAREGVLALVDPKPLPLLGAHGAPYRAAV